YSSAYAASKGGVIALTHALALSLGPRIRVNSISPGWIDVREPEEKHAEPLRDIEHSQHPAGRVGEPRDIAALAAFLLSPDAAFMTGQNVIADGGMTRKMCYVD
ncbi:MAG TPA: SDR family oxidoreductase, partial [Gammaproteobacteria bacterium]